MLIGVDGSAGLIFLCAARMQIHSMSDARSTSAMASTHHLLGHREERRAEQIIRRLVRATEAERFVEADRGIEERRRAEVDTARLSLHGQVECLGEERMPEAPAA